MAEFDALFQTPTLGLSAALEAFDYELEESGSVAPADVFDEITQAERDAEELHALADRTVGAEGIALEMGLAHYRSIAARYGINTEATTAEGLAVEAAQVAAALESATDVALESWSVKDLWDSAGKIERNGVELKQNLAKLSNAKKWFNENALIINSVGLLTYLSVNDAPPSDISHAVRESNKALSNLHTEADEAFKSVEQLMTAIRKATISDDNAVDALLRQCLQVKNPASEIAQRVDGLQTLGNRRLEVKLAKLRAATAVHDAKWTQVGSVRVIKLGRRPGRYSGGLLPEWMIAFSTGTRNTSATLGAIAAGAVAATGGSKIVTVAGMALVATGALAGGIIITTKAVVGVDALIDGFKEKHQVSFADIHGALSDIETLAHRSVAWRRQYPKKWRFSSEYRDELKDWIAGIDVELTPASKEKLAMIKRMVLETDRLAWEASQAAFDLSQVLVVGANELTAKMVRTAIG